MGKQIIADDTHGAKVDLRFGYDKPNRRTWLLVRAIPTANRITKPPPRATAKGALVNSATAPACMAPNGKRLQVMP